MAEENGEFKCPVCPKSYVKDAFLINHVRKVHPNYKPEEVNENTVSDSIPQENAQPQEAQPQPQESQPQPQEEAQPQAQEEEIEWVQSGNKGEGSPWTDQPTLVWSVPRSVAEGPEGSLEQWVEERNRENKPVDADLLEFLRLKNKPKDELKIVEPEPFEYEPSEKLDDHKDANRVGTQLLECFVDRNFSKFLLECSFLSEYNKVHINDVFGHILTVLSYDLEYLSIYKRFVSAYLMILFPDKVTIRNKESYILCELLKNELGYDNTLKYVLIPSLKNNNEFKMFVSDDRLKRALEGEQLDYYAFEDDEEKLRELACDICHLASQMTKNNVNSS